MGFPPVEGDMLGKAEVLVAGRELGHSPFMPLGIKARFLLIETDEVGTKRDNELEQDSSLN